MIAYNTQWLDSLAVKEQARKWYYQGLISGTQLQTSESKFPSHFYTPNIFVRIGLGIFCWILVSSVFGLFGMALIDSFQNTTSSGVVCLLFSGALFAALEFFIKDKKYYKAGIDDALLYLALSLAITGICLIFSPLFKDHTILYCIVAFPFLAAAALRYTDTVASAFAFACMVAFVFLLLKEATFTARLIPVFCMLLSAGVYYIIKRLSIHDKLRYWKDCLMVLEACSLLLFYVSGNYFVVEDVGEMLFTGFHIPFSFIFWLFTAITPLAYTYFGLKNHDRLLLRTGLIMIAFSVLTFKYYFSLGHHEMTLTIAGTILVAVAYFCIRYLKHQSGRFTYVEDRSDENHGFNHVEALIISQTAGAPTAAEPQFDFGGGKFGGGGAGGNY
jgi:uncharacterized membrane protein YgcG